MTRDELIDALAKHDASFDGRPFERLGAADKKRYRERCAGQLKIIDTGEREKTAAIESERESMLARINELTAQYQEEYRLRHAERERTAKLEVALKPFADAACTLHNGNQDHHEIWESPAAMIITAGDLRAAGAALSPAADEGNGNG